MKIRGWLLLFGVLLSGPVSADPAPEPGGRSITWLGAVEARLAPPWVGSFLRDCDRQLLSTHALNNPSLTAVARLVVGPGCVLEEVSLVRASGAAEFDSAAVEVARAAAPFPPPPLEVLSDDGRARVAWTFARQPAGHGAADAAVEVVEMPLEQAVPALVAAGRGEVALMRLARSAGGDAALLRRLSRGVVGTWVGSITPPPASRPAAPPKPDALALVLGSSSEAVSARVAAAEALGLALQGSVDAVPSSLRRALADAEPQVRAAAGRAFARLGQDGGRSKGLFYRISPLLQDPDACVRSAAVAAAAALYPENAAADLLVVCKRQKVATVLESCALALARLEDAEARARAVKVTDHAVAEVRRAALRGLAARGDTLSREVVARHLPALDAAEAFALRLSMVTAAVRREGVNASLPELASLAAGASADQRARLAAAWLAATE